MASSSRLIASLGVVPAVALALSACGGKKLDTGAAEQQIKQDLAKRYPALKVSSVNCPDDVEAKKGNTFQCQTKLVRGITAPVVVSQKDDDGTVTFELRLPKGSKALAKPARHERKR
jgi:Domain of unknown function (DUF4333)